MRRILLAFTLPILLLLTGCGSSADHNDADVAFAQQMIPHHQQAVFMTGLVPGASASPEVQALAAQIAATQDPEITTMRGFLEDWGLNEMSGDMEDHDMAGMDMGDGMASDNDLETLANLQGDAFDQEFLTLMTAHHEGAIEMATTELEDGKDPAAQKLAQQIVDAQKAEIMTMQALLR